MMDLTLLLTALQNGDSLFPGGTTAFSWGLEGLVQQGAVAHAADLERLLAAQLRYRWAGFDRAFLTAAHRSCGDLDRVAVIDRMCEASILAEELRSGSRRAGGALVAVHARLGVAAAASYKERIQQDDALGHLPVAQGLIWAEIGLDEAEAAVLSAYTYLAGSAAAAIRLGIAGHLDAQRIITRLRPVIAGLAGQLPPPPHEAGAFAPRTDIAAMRHETTPARLFAN
jgi:urease accessory protein